MTVRLSAESRRIWDSAGGDGSLGEKAEVMSAKLTVPIKAFTKFFTASLDGEELLDSITSFLESEGFIYHTTFRDRGQVSSLQSLDAIKFDRFGNYEMSMDIYNRAWIKVKGKAGVVEDVYNRFMKIVEGSLDESNSVGIFNVVIQKRFRDEKIDQRPSAVSTERAPYSSFYPWLKELESVKGPNYSVDQFVDDYIASDESVLINYGPPGTGKTTLTNHIISRITEKDNTWTIYLLTSPDLINYPELLTEWLMERDDKTLLIFEDLDDIIKPRNSKVSDSEEGSSLDSILKSRAQPSSQGNSFMSTLLNIADGLSNNKIKMVFNTNQMDLSNIDSALWRPGRCFSYIYFNYLSLDECNAVRKDLGIDPIDNKVLPVPRVPLAMAIKITENTVDGAKGLGLHKDRIEDYEKYAKYFGT